jgi:hypothetical protein
MLIVELVGSSRSPRLTPGEVDQLFDVAAMVHHHSATLPSQPIFWWRSETTASQRLWN